MSNDKNDSRLNDVERFILNISNIALSLARQRPVTDHIANALQRVSAELSPETNANDGEQPLSHTVNVSRQQ